MIYGNIRKEKETPVILIEDIASIKEKLPGWFQDKYNIELKEDKEILNNKYWVSMKDVLLLLK